MRIVTKPFLFLVVSLMFFSSAYGQETNPDFFRPGEIGGEHTLPTYHGEIIENRVIAGGWDIHGFGATVISVDRGFRRPVKFELKTTLYGVKTHYVENWWGTGMPLIYFELHQIVEPDLKHRVLYPGGKAFLYTYIQRDIYQHPEDEYEMYCVVSTIRGGAVKNLLESPLIVIGEKEHQPEMEILDEHDSLKDGPLRLGFRN